MVDDVEVQGISGPLVPRLGLPCQFVLTAGHDIEPPVRVGQHLVEVDGLNVGLQFQLAFGRQLSAQDPVELPEPALLFAGRGEFFQGLFGIFLCLFCVLKGRRAGDDLLFQVFPLPGQFGDLPDARFRSGLVEPVQSGLQRFLLRFQPDLVHLRRLKSFARSLQSICHGLLLSGQFPERVLCFLQRLIVQFLLCRFQFFLTGLLLPGQVGDRRLQLAQFFCACLIGGFPFRQVLVQFVEAFHLLLQFLAGGLQFRLERAVLFPFRL